MIEVVFLDMDAVLVNFYRGCLELLGHDPNMDLSDKTPEELYDLGWMVDGTQEEFWEVIDDHKEKFWANLKPMPWKDKLYDGCKALVDQVCLLSTPAHRAKGSSTGKHQWIAEHLGGTKEYIFTPRKFWCAANNRVLVDDKVSHVKKWAKYGGVGILFKAPWNDGGLEADQVLSVVGQLDAMRYMNVLGQNEDNLKISGLIRSPEFEVTIEDGSGYKRIKQVIPRIEEE